MAEDDAIGAPHVLICDRDRKWSSEVQRQLQDAGTSVVFIPRRAPNANAHAERFVRSIKEECLDRLIPIGERHFRRAVTEYVAHYHGERNHQGLDNRLISGPLMIQMTKRVQRRQRLGGLLNSTSERRDRRVRQETEHYGLARENPRWGYQRIVGELKGVGVVVSATTIKKILGADGLGPTVSRGPSWREFLRTQANSIIAVNFFTVETVWLQRVYVLFSIELGSRRVHRAGCTAHPDVAWVTQQARQVAWALVDRKEPVRFLIRDRDRKFTRCFDAVFEAQGVRVVRTPVQAPEANGIAERFVRTALSECLDWLLILNARHLEHTPKVFVDHYNSGRPHRSLALAPPNGRPPAKPKTIDETINVRRRDRLGGLLHEYERAA